MRIFSAIGIGAATGLFTMAIVSTSFGAHSPSLAASDLKCIGSPIVNYRQGITAYREGWYQLALPSLECASNDGVIGARLVLARMYAEGKGVFKNDARAFEIYKDIADENAEADPEHPAARFAAKAFVALGNYYRTGIKKIGLRKDDKVAADLYSHAASYFHNAIAQYKLANMYLVGAGVPKNAVRASKWLNRAANKGHAPSQALLGQILWEGELIRRRPGRALGLLELAVENADPEDAEWINAIYKKIFTVAEPNQKKRADTFVANWVKRRGGKKKLTSNVDARGELSVEALQNRRALGLLQDKTPTTSKPDIMQGSSLSSRIQK